MSKQVLIRHFCSASQLYLVFFVTHNWVSPISDILLKHDPHRWGDPLPLNLSPALVFFSIRILPPSAKKVEPQIVLFDNSLALSLENMMICGETVCWLKLSSIWTTFQHHAHARLSINICLRTPGPTHTLLQNDCQAWVEGNPRLPFKASPN